MAGNSNDNAPRQRQEGSDTVGNDNAPRERQEGNDNAPTAPADNAPTESTKRPKGTRGPTKKLEGRYHFTEIAEDGEPIAPVEFARKYVNQCGVLVRENIPINRHRWKSANKDEPGVVPETEKDMLFESLKENFFFPEGTDIDKVKEWTLKKMCNQFKDFKTKLHRDFVKKGLTPDWNKKGYLKLRPYWNEFVEYRLSEDSKALSSQNTENASHKEYNHHLGTGGYKSARRKWEAMEQDLLNKGIRPATLDWPERSKNFLYAHGATLNPVDGSVVYGEEIAELATRLMEIIKLVGEGAIKPNREKDELTLALGNPEHTGRCRGKGAVPWKYAFAGDIDSYRSRKRRKAEQEERVRMLEETVKENQAKMQESEAKMQEEVKRQVLAALSQINPGSSAGTGAQNASASHLRSSCASTELPEVPAVEQRYPVDEINQRTSCELHRPFANITLKVYVC